jgi:hypothetical protein
MRPVSGLWLALLGLALGPGAAAAEPGDAPEPSSDLLAFLEFLGDEGTAGNDWNSFFDSLPERPEDAPGLITGPVAAEESRP